MVDGLHLLSVDKARQADVPSGGTALQVLARDGQSGSLALLNASAIDKTKQRGLLEAGRNQKLARMAHLSPDGVGRTGASQLVFNDSFDVNATPSIDTQKWVVTQASMTPGLSTSVMGIIKMVGATLNTGPAGGASGNEGAMFVTQRFFPFVGRNTLVFRARVLHSPHIPDQTIEHGFGSPTSATGSPTVTAVDGAHWRKNNDGFYVPVVAFNNVEYEGPSGTTPISQAQFLQFVPPGAWFYAEVTLCEFCAVFRLQTHDGQTITEQTVFFNAIQTFAGVLQGVGTFSKSHVQVFHRQYTKASLRNTILPMQGLIASTSVWLLDNAGPTYRTSMSQLGAGSLFSPATGGSIGQNTQVAGWLNNAVPATITVSNTSPTYTNLGGQWLLTPTTGVETDDLVFSFQLPVTWTFIATGIRISGVVSTTLGATASILTWGIGFNGSAANLGTGGHMRKIIGTMGFPASSVAGTTASDIVWEGQEAMTPGLFNALILKAPSGTAGGTIRGTISVDGYFE